MNKVLITILFALLVYQTPVISALNNSQSTTLSSIKCAPQLQRHLNKILQVSEAKALIESIQRQGPIQIVVLNAGLSNKFGAYWDPDQRTICISLSFNETEGTIIGSILFELHNASVNSRFDQLDRLAARGQINKAAYVRSMEYLEYINSLNAAKIAERGIQMGVLPRDSRLPTYSSFEEHFSEQRRSGHSNHFARIYDDLCMGGFQG